MPLTITEALAEIKTIGKRIETKQEFITSYLFRQEGLKDPLEKDGGSVEVIKRERQAIADLGTRIVTLRRGIARAAAENDITVGGVTRSISDWLTWRRDVSPNAQHHLKNMSGRLTMLRETAKRSGSAVIQNVASISQDTKPTDYVVNIDEGQLAREIEQMEEMLGTLDGQLSLKNATLMIEE